MHFYSLENHVLGCLLHGATTDCGHKLLLWHRFVPCIHDYDCYSVPIRKCAAATF